MSFCHLVKSLIGEIESCRSNIKLSDDRSLYEAKELIISIENRLTKRMNNEHNFAAPKTLSEHLEYSFDKILDSIRNILNSFHHYQSQINKHKRSRTTHHSSTIEEKPSIQPKTRNNDDDDDDQSSEASHSSIGDEVLMEVARDAYEHRPHR
jgi:hypothetical protein